MEVKKLLTRANINDYLINFIGISPDEVTLMPDYVKIDLVEDDMDNFKEFIYGDEYEEFEGA